MRARTLLVVGLAILAVARSADAATITVTSPNDVDDGTCAAHCSLREAIDEANTTTALDEIVFDGSGTITPATALPPIDDPVVVNGTDAADCGGARLGVQLDGNDQNFTGLELAAGSDGSRICQLNVRDFLDGIVVRSDDATIDGNRVGTDEAGAAAEGNDNSGIQLRGDGATVAGNLVSGNVAGIDVVVPFGFSVDGTTIAGNHVGTNLAGTAALPNITGIFTPATTTNTVIGGDTAAERNVVSGNSGTGMIVGAGAVTGNYVGLNAAGTAALANTVGMTANGPVVVGGATAALRNVVSGNDTGVDVAGANATIRGNWIGPYATGTGNDDQDVGVSVDGDDASIDDNVIVADLIGVEILAADDAVVQGNTVGLDATGVPAGGSSGVLIASAATDALIGGAGAGEGNTVAGNDVGIDSTGSGTRIEGNVIGLDAAGVAAPNVDGISLSAGADTTTVGGAAAGAGNVVAGNTGPGVEIGDATGITVRGNDIGVGLDGATARPNGSNGIEVASSNDVTLLDNTVANSGDQGIDFFSAASSAGAVVEDNTVEGNGGQGVHLRNVTGGRIEDNRIAGNGGHGIVLHPDTSGVAIAGNGIDGNGDLGIDLGDDGVTANDAGDADSGANRLQNFPVLTFAETDGSVTAVTGTIDTVPGAPVRIELFSSPACDDSEHGQGDVLLGSTDVVAGSGPTAFSATVAATAAGRAITATATMTDGAIIETSELSRCFTATQKPVEQQQQQQQQQGAGAGTGTTTTQPPPAAITPPPVVSLPPPPPKFPAKMRVLRNGIDDGVLDMLVEITSRAVTPGAVLSIDYESSGRHTRFTVPITGTQVKVRKRLPSSQPKDTGITTVTYAGNSAVAPDEARLRAADGKSLLERGTTALSGGRLVVDGTVSDAAEGVVRIRLGFDRPDGSTGFAYWNAKIDDGTWRISQALTGDAARGGMLSIQFTGYERRNLRGEQTSKEVLPSA